VGTETAAAPIHPAPDLRMAPMNLESWLAVLDLIHDGATVAWCVASLITRCAVPGSLPHAKARRLKSEMRLPTRYGWAAPLALAVLHHSPWLTLLYAVDSYIWWRWTDDEDDDDPWKRRARALKDKLVASLPAPAGASAGA
jgi:hypothetical protein